jgi:hypothetical protein
MTMNTRNAEAADHRGAEAAPYFFLTIGSEPVAESASRRSEPRYDRRPSVDGALSGMIL